MVSAAVSSVKAAKQGIRQGTASGTAVFFAPRPDNIISTLPRRPGFTLIELLVVIGIIGILLSLLIPNLKNARLTAQSLRCTSNLKQLGMACNFYATDNENYLCTTSWIGAPATTIYYYNVNPANGAAANHAAFNGSAYYLQSYISKPELFQCPASTIPTTLSMSQYCATGATYVSLTGYNWMMRKTNANWVFSPISDQQHGFDQYQNKPLFLDPVRDMTSWSFDVSTAEIHGGKDRPLPILMSSGDVIQFDRRKYPLVWDDWSPSLFTIVTDILRSAN